jgi:hypothetical protein
MSAGPPPPSAPPLPTSIQSAASAASVNPYPPSIIVPTGIGLVPTSASNAASTSGGVPPAAGNSKRKEIYKYTAPWTVYSMNWSVRPDKRFRLALGSFVEEYNNRVQIVSLDEDTSGRD